MLCSRVIFVLKNDVLLPNQSCGHHGEATTTQVRKKHPCKVENGVSLKYKTKTELGKLKPSDMIPDFGGDVPHSDNESD